MTDSADQIRWIEVKRPSKIDKFHHVYPPFAQLNSRDILAMDTKAASNFCLR